MLFIDETLPVSVIPEAVHLAAPHSLTRPDGSEATLPGKDGLALGEMSADSVTKRSTTYGDGIRVGIGQVTRSKARD